MLNAHTSQLNDIVIISIMYNLRD